MANAPAVQTEASQRTTGKYASWFHAETAF